MVGDISYDGRVTIVTGVCGSMCTRGMMVVFLVQPDIVIPLARLWTRLPIVFATHSASVVVNDYDVLSGCYNSILKAVDTVVEEICKAGGKAVVNYNSVTDGGKIIETVMNAFGRVDILINRVDIMREKMFARMTDADWDIIQAVHVKGSYAITNAAWPLKKKQKYGRIIMTASAAGLYGNIGHANYSAALVGFSSVLAKEGEQHSLVEPVVPPRTLNNLWPQVVCPAVGYLCHESSEETGSIFEAGAGIITKVRWERFKGAMFQPDEALIPYL